jgi:hypothetical protein
LQRFFHTAPLSLRDLAICVLLSSAIFWSVEFEKLLRRRNER